MQNESKNYKYLINGRLLRAVLTGTSGGKLKNEVDYIRNYYKGNTLMDSLISTSSNLKIHNLVEQIKNIKKNYSSFYSKIHNNNFNCEKPRPKPLKNANHITLYTDGYKGTTLKRKNLVGINLDNRMIYTHVLHEPLIKLIGSLKNIKNINLNYSNGSIYLILNYIESPILPISKDIVPKYAGLDIGIINLASIYIHDTTSNSYIIKGTPLIEYNSKFNRFISKLNHELHYCLDDSRTIYLNNFKSYLYEKRNNYFTNEFHKLSNLILKYLHSNDVSHLVVSTKISTLKNTGRCNIAKKTKQHFLGIPLLQLINYLNLKAPLYGIKIIFVDESYTSKTSCISKDIFEIQALSLTKKLSTNDFGGNRVKRGLFKDKKTKLLINADINGAFNICKLGMIHYTPLDLNCKKLCNPIIIDTRQQSNLKLVA